MTTVVASRSRYTGNLSLSSLNNETTVLEIAAQNDDYIVEGWLDLGNLINGDTVIVKEYVAIDGINYRLFTQVQMDGPIPEPAIRFHSKLFSYNAKYKVTITQTAGSPRNYPYSFILEVLGTA
jgi:hypothetical protein